MRRQSVSAGPSGVPASAGEGDGAAGVGVLGASTAAAVSVLAVRRRRRCGTDEIVARRHHGVETPGRQGVQCHVVAQPTRRLAGGDIGPARRSGRRDGSGGQGRQRRKFALACVRRGRDRVRGRGGVTGPDTRFGDGHEGAAAEQCCGGEEHADSPTSVLRPGGSGWSQTRTRRPTEGRSGRGQGPLSPRTPRSGRRCPPPRGRGRRRRTKARWWRRRRSRRTRPPERRRRGRRGRSQGRTERHGARPRLDRPAWRWRWRWTGTATDHGRRTPVGQMVAGAAAGNATWQ